MPVIRNLTDLPKFFKGYKGLVSVYESPKSGMIARRAKTKFRWTFGHKRFTSVYGAIMSAWKALRDGDPKEALNWKKRAKFYKKWYAGRSKLAYGQKLRFWRCSGMTLTDQGLFGKCNSLAYYGGMNIIRWKAPEINEKIPQPRKPDISWDADTKTVVVNCPPTELPDGAKEATIQVFAKVYSAVACPIFLVGCVDGLNGERKIILSQFTAASKFFGRRTAKFSGVASAKVRVWTYTLVSQGEEFGVLDSPPSDFSELEIPRNPRGKKYTDKIRKRYREYRKKMYYQRIKMAGKSPRKL